MKRYSGIITVAIEINAIAKQLSTIIPDDCKHKEQIMDAIILAGSEAKTLHFLHNAMNGFSNDIDFKPGDTIICEDETCFRNKAGEDSKSQMIGEATVVEVNPYRLNNKLRVEYNEFTSRGEQGRGSRQVDHTKCSRIPTRLEETEKEESNLSIMQP